MLPVRCRKLDFQILVVVVVASYHTQICDIPLGLKLFFQLVLALYIAIKSDFLLTWLIFLDTSEFLPSPRVLNPS